MQAPETDSNTIEHGPGCEEVAFLQSSPLASSNEESGSVDPLGKEQPEYPLSALPD